MMTSVEDVEKDNNIPSAILEELEAVNAIYPQSVHILESHIKHVEVILNVPSEAAHTSLSLSLPLSYPDVAPVILGSHSTSSLIKGAATQFVDVARDVLSRVFQPGIPCLYDLIDELMNDLPDAESIIEPARTQDQRSEEVSLDKKDDMYAASPPDWHVSEPVNEKKSVFVARAANVESVQQAKSFIQHLITTDKKAAKATHNITAWRIQDKNKEHVTFQDCNDDGEDAAGGRVLHLMQLMDVWNVLIVVTRWYGGVHLGPDRFRIINAVAREAILARIGSDTSKAAKRK